MRLRPDSYLVPSPVLLPTRTAWPRLRRGSVLVEFALIALLLYLIFAATLEFGRALFGAQVLQQATDVMARELSRTPLPLMATLKQVLDDTTGQYDTNGQVKKTIYDASLLVVPFNVVYQNGQSATDYFADKPIVNRLLLPLMIVDNENQVLRYPGLIPDAGQPDGFSRNIAVVGSYSPGAGPFSGSEHNITTVPVVQEILPSGADPSDPNTSPFSLVSTVQPPSGRGMVALRINYPFQAATMSATAPNADPSLPNFNVIDASDDPSLGTPPPEGDMGVYSGQFGLGNQRAFGKIVRPFRRLLSAQAIYRREVFGP
jgi:TadE-like protein